MQQENRDSPLPNLTSTTAVCASSIVGPSPSSFTFYIYTHARATNYENINMVST